MLDVEALTKYTQQLMDFVIEKAEAGRIDWQNDAPYFWGTIDELKGILHGGELMPPLPEAATLHDLMNYCHDLGMAMIEVERLRRNILKWDSYGLVDSRKDFVAAGEARGIEPTAAIETWVDLLWQAKAFAMPGPRAAAPPALFHRGDSVEFHQRYEMPPHVDVPAGVRGIVQSVDEGQLEDLWIVLDHWEDNDCPEIDQPLDWACPRVQIYGTEGESIHQTAANFIRKVES